MRSLAVLLASVVAPVSLAACGADGPEPKPRPVEAAEQVPRLPAGWSVYENPGQGFALGAPPGWREGADCLEPGSEPGSASVLCSPDRLVTLSISADRTDEAVELEPGDFAVRTLESLGEEGYRELAPGRPEGFKGHYEGASASATGEATETGVTQEVTVVVLRRDRLANFTAVIAANAEQPTEPAVSLAKQALRTLRSQPVGAPAG